MSKDTPPDSGERTVLLPTPGGRRQGTRAPPFSQAAPVAGTVDHAKAPRSAPDIDAATLSARSSNPLIAAAGSLFTLAVQLRNATQHTNPEGLANDVAREIATFEARARSRGAPDSQQVRARYALCTLLDEVVLSTPWGAESAWSHETLLVRFHREAFGGERFFAILEEALQRPAEQIDLIEFLYLCLAFGLQGKYKVRNDGYRQLQDEMDRAYEVIHRYRGDFDRELSPHWQGVKDQRMRLANVLPLWAVAAIASGLLLLTYVGFLFTINMRSDPAVSQIASLATQFPLIKPPGTPLPTAPPPTHRATLAMLLSVDIKEGLVEVVDLDDRSTVSLWGLFEPGEAQVPEVQHAMLGRVAAAIDQFPGRVEVLGHSDNKPIRSLRFPDNWVLSERRAQAVQRLLVAILPADRVSFQGLGDSRPLVENDSPTNRAINRRVEIILYPDSPEL